jgi:predicted Zn-dependent protease with MMP-like domain
LQWGQRLSYPRSMSTRQTLAPSLADIETLAQAAVERLPELFRDHLGNVLLRIEDFPDAEVMAEMELESEWEILGLYQGRHVGLKGDEPTGALPDMIFLYRRPILDEWCQTDDSLEAIVTHVLVHEVGHHFGLSDDDIDAIEAGVE